MNRIALVVALLGNGAATPLAAAPLCHDLKGLYTPCPPAVAGHAARARAAAAEKAAALDRSASTARPRSQRPERPPVIARARLCHDLKGLFTPCPR